MNLVRTTGVGPELLGGTSVGRDKIGMPPVHSANHRQMNRNDSAGDDLEWFLDHSVMKLGMGNKKCNQFCSIREVFSPFQTIPYEQGFHNKEVQ